MAGKYRFRLKQVAAALATNRGKVSSAAAYLGCSQHTIYKYLQRSKKLKLIQFYARQAFLDKAEDQLEIAVEKGMAWAIQFTLKYLGKDRGYSDRQEMLIATGGVKTYIGISPDDWDRQNVGVVMLTDGSAVSDLSTPDSDDNDFEDDDDVDYEDFDDDDFTEQDEGYDDDDLDDEDEDADIDLDEFINMKFPQYPVPGGRYRTLPNYLEEDLDSDPGEFAT